MCGPNFCAMRISQRMKNCEFDAEAQANIQNDEQ